MTDINFSYIYSQTGDDLLTHFGVLRQMRDAFTEHGFCDTAAYHATNAAVTAIEAVVKMLDEDDDLRDVWLAIAEYAAGDSNREQLSNAINTYESSERVGMIEDLSEAHEARLVRGQRGKVSITTCERRYRLICGYCDAAIYDDLPCICPSCKRELKAVPSVFKTWRMLWADNPKLPQPVPTDMLDTFVQCSNDGLDARSSIIDAIHAHF